MGNLPKVHPVKHTDIRSSKLTSHTWMNSVRMNAHAQRNGNGPRLARPFHRGYVTELLASLKSEGFTRYYGCRFVIRCLQVHSAFDWARVAHLPSSSLNSPNRRTYLFIPDFIYLDGALCAICVNEPTNSGSLGIRASQFVRTREIREGFVRQN